MVYFLSYMLPDRRLTARTEMRSSMGDFQSWVNQLNYDQLIEMVITVLAAVICITLHEVSHGYAAYRLGDPTAKTLGG